MYKYDIGKITYKVKVFPGKVTVTTKGYLNSSDLITIGTTLVTSTTRPMST